MLSSDECERVHVVHTYTYDTGSSCEAHYGLRIRMIPDKFLIDDDADK
jgi:hypothetical protein